MIGWLVEFLIHHGMHFFATFCFSVGDCLAVFSGLHYQSDFEKEKSLPLQN